jgi:hypothetical protein
MVADDEFDTFDTIFIAMVAWTKRAATIMPNTNAMFVGMLRCCLGIGKLGSENNLIFVLNFKKL